MLMMALLVAHVNHDLNEDLQPALVPDGGGPAAIGREGGTELRRDLAIPIRPPPLTWTWPAHKKR